jgi:hypothetical protein
MCVSSGIQTQMYDVVLGQVIAKYYQDKYMQFHERF